MDQNDLLEIRRYLAPHANSGWRWDEEGQTVETAASRTIAFRAELAHVLSRLASRGLPPMEAVVLLMAACRPTWPDLSCEMTASAGLMASLVRDDLPPWLLEVFHGLDGVRQLPAELREPVEAKAVLAELVFEGCLGRTSVVAAQRIVSFLHEGPLLPLVLRPQTDSGRPFAAMLHDYRKLCEGLPRVDPEVLALRRRTGLDRLVEPAEIDLDPAERTRQLIARLTSDEELGGVARIARQLMAATHLPRSLSDPEDLPLGGVSDIANRGQLDRLLLSELAHDDLTLAVRLAVNEALYLRRESPPRTPPKHRTVLIDAGIRVWGVPRVFSTAVALALAATAQHGITVDAHRACGSHMAPVDLTRREGVVSHLGVLEPEAHPGRALPALQAALKDRQDIADVVIVTGEDVADDPQFRQALAALELPSLYLATVSRDGRFRIALRSARGSKRVCEARLDLESLLAPPRRPAPPLVDKNVPENLPAIFAVRPYPLRMPHDRLNAASLWPVGDQGILTVTADRRLLHWQPGQRGGRQLTDDLPGGMILWCETDPPSAVCHAVVGNLQQRSLNLVTADLEACWCGSVRLELGPEQPANVCGHGRKVFVVYADRAEVYDMEGGRKLQSLRLPQPRSQHGRFYWGNNAWWALGDDGLGGGMQEVSPTHSDVMTMFDSPAHSGPVGITWTGELYNPLRRREVTKLNHGLGVAMSRVYVSRDGRRAILAAGPRLSQMRLVDLATAHGEPVRTDPQRDVERPLWDRLDMRSLRRRFQGALVDESGLLTLISKNSAVRFEHHQGRIMLRPGPKSGRGTIPFHEIPGPPGVGYALRAAEWPDGSRAVLDSRGLLHLQSADRALPELTLVLYEGAVSGWCADGRLFGSLFFLGDGPTALPSEVFYSVLDPFASRLA